MIQFRRVRLARSALPWMDWGSERRASRAGGFSGLMVRTLFRTSRVAHWLIFKTRLRTIDDSSVSPRQSLHRSSSRPKIERHRAYSQSRYAHAPGILQSASAADMVWIAIQASWTAVVELTSQSLGSYNPLLRPICVGLRLCTLKWFESARCARAPCTAMSQATEAQTVYAAFLHAHPFLAARGLGLPQPYSASAS